VGLERSEGRNRSVCFFFFLNLYKATFLCLSVVYLIVDAVYGCERLCGER
jgi:hypothetical protein